MLGQEQDAEVFPARCDLAVKVCDRVASAQCRVPVLVLDQSIAFFSFFLLLIESFNCSTCFDEIFLAE